MPNDFENIQFPDVVTAHERTIQAAHDNPRPTETYRAPQTPRPESRSGAIETYSYDPRMLQYIADITLDTRRLIHNPDGSITIANNPQR
ncbi:MAG: hypothetical protein ABIR37_05025 [Candidatus Saccharimonadales bacterium]